MQLPTACSLIRLTPTESEKERREYELGLTWAAMGKINEKNKDESARQFSSLQWRDEARIVLKQRKIEDEREEEMLHKKKDAIRSMEEEDDGGSEAEEDEMEEPEAPVVPLPKLTKPKQDVLTPKEVIQLETGNFLFSYF